MNPTYLPSGCLPQNPVAGQKVWKQVSKIQVVIVQGRLSQEPCQFTVRQHEGPLFFQLPRLHLAEKEESFLEQWVSPYHARKEIRFALATVGTLAVSQVCPHSLGGTGLDGLRSVGVTSKLVFNTFLDMAVRRGVRGEVNAYRSCLSWDFIHDHQGFQKHVIF